MVGVNASGFLQCFDANGWHHEGHLASKKRNIAEVLFQNYK